MTMLQGRASATCSRHDPRARRSMIFIQRLADGSRELVASFNGVNGAPAWSPDGRTLAGLKDLTRVIASDQTFVRTVAHKLFVYAVGRDLRPVDRLRIDHAVAQLTATEKVPLRDLIHLVVRDPAFR